MSCGLSSLCLSKVTVVHVAIFFALERKAKYGQFCEDLNHVVLINEGCVVTSNLVDFIRGRC